MRADKRNVVGGINWRLSARKGIRHLTRGSEWIAYPFPTVLTPLSLPGVWRNPHFFGDVQTGTETERAGYIQYSSGMGASELLIHFPPSLCLSVCLGSGRTHSLLILYKLETFCYHMRACESTCYCFWMGSGKTWTLLVGYKLGQGLKHFRNAQPCPNKILQ